MIKKLLVLASVVSTLAVAGSAGAATTTWAYGGVTFDPFSGTGFVPKGDLQELFGWNNAEYSANVGNLRFTWLGSLSWWGHCELQLARTDAHGQPYVERRIIGWGGPSTQSLATFTATPAPHGHHGGHDNGVELAWDPSTGFAFPLANLPLGAPCPDIGLLFSNVIQAVYVTQPELVASGTLYVNDKEGFPTEGFAIYSFSTRPF